MQLINRLFTNICTKKLKESQHFYTSLFSFEVQFESDWFIQLKSRNSEIELAFIEQSSDLIPKPFRKDPEGLYLTFVVDDCESVFKKAQSYGFEVIAGPEDMFYGQRRCLLKDPNGVLVDISSVMSPSK